MITQGIVYKIKGGMAHVRCARPESCDHCENSAICSKKETELRAYDSIGVSVGDLVEVETREDARSMLVISYIFLVPVAIIFLTYLLFELNKYLAFLGIFMFLAYLFGLKYMDKNFDPQVKIIRIIEKKTEDQSKSEKEVLN